MTERRTLILLVLVLVLQLVMLGAQAPDPAGQGNLLEGLALRTLAPVAHVVAVTFDAGASLRRAVRTRSRLASENTELERENRDLREEVLRLSGVEAELERLSEALDYEPPAGLEMTVADVAHVDHVSWLKTLVLRLPEERRERLGIGPSAPVVTPAGLVGRVVTVAGDYLRVQLITDRASSVGAMVERSRRQGIVRGAGGGLLSFDYVPRQSDVRAGDRVVTAGIDGVYPRGLPIGTVSEVSAGDDLFHRIRVLPAVDLGRLDQVYVLAFESLPEELQEPSLATP